MSSRKIKFEKILNARDMGGLLNVYGDTISSRLLLRSANLTDATEVDKQVLQKQYHIAKIVDLRTEMEAATIRDIFLAKEEYLNAAFGAIQEQYKNTDTFLCEGLNISRKLIEKFQKSVLWER